MVVPPTTRLPLAALMELSVPVALNTSWTLAPPLRARVSVAPLKLSATLNSGSYTCTSASNTTAAPPTVKMTLPPSVTARPNVVSSEPSAL